MKDKIASFFSKPFFSKPKYIISIWFLVSLIVALKQYKIESYNNYKIFRQVYFHVIEKLNLYLEYPAEYFDHNHYGPFFSIFIAPFALLPDYLALPLWTMTNAGFMIFAISKLPLEDKQKSLALWLILPEFITSILSVQFNPILTSFILLSFVFIHQKKDHWATLFIVLGLFIKLYGIVGLAFFFLSKNKIKFILSFIGWSVLIFAIPMLISSPEYIIQSYQQWFERLVLKNSENASLTSYQDYSIMGITRRVLQDTSISNLPFLVSGVVLFGVQYLKISNYKHTSYRLLLLCLTLIFTVIYSSGSESPTYIIAFTGVVIWYVIQPKEIHNVYRYLFVFALILTSFSTTDLIPQYLKDNFVRPYALKALPSCIIWFVILYEMTTRNLNLTQYQINE